MFLMKKILAQFLMPLSLGLAISCLGLFLLLFSSRQRSGKILASFGILAITLLSLDPLADRLLSPLESRYPPYALNSSSAGTDISYVVVLGGGHTSDPGLPVTAQIGPSGLARLIEAVRIYRLHPGSRLLLSGGGVFDPVPEADLMAAVATSIGVPPEDIIKESASLDTKDEARIIKSMIGEKPFILVTSASHMPRSMAMFRQQGMAPIPAPTQQLVKKQTRLRPGDFFPNTDALHKSERVFYEYLGLVWAKISRQV